jgi:hypothetical protein
VRRRLDWQEPQLGARRQRQGRGFLGAAHERRRDRGAVAGRGVDVIEPRVGMMDKLVYTAAHPIQDK